MAVGTTNVFQPLIVAIIILLALMVLISCCRRRRMRQQYANSSIDVEAQPAPQLATGYIPMSYPPYQSPLPQQQQPSYQQPYQFQYRPPPGEPMPFSAPPVQPVTYPPLAHTAPLPGSAGPSSGAQYVTAQDGAADVPEPPPPYEAVPKP